MTISDLFFADLVRVASTGTGTGPLALGEAFPGHRGFADVVPEGAAFPYAIAGISHAGEWETGMATLDEAGRLVRTPIASSGGGAAVDFSAGLKSVALSPGAQWLAAVDGHGHDHIAMQAGSAAAPAAAFAGDGDSGLFSPGADRIGLATGGVERMRIDENGRCGIGTMTPEMPMDIRAHNPRRGILALLANEENVSPSGAQLHFYQAASGDIVIGQPPGIAAFSIWRDRYFGADGTELLRVAASGTVQPGADNGQSLGDPALRWSVIYAGSGAISTSDAREKEQVGEMPDAWLDAWGAVGWQRYRFVGRSRWHAGLVAQQVHAAFAGAGLDAFEIGLCCRDAWDAEQDEAGVETRAAGERWGLRYDECFAMEAAWTRRAIARLERRVEGAGDAVG